MATDLLWPPSLPQAPLNQSFAHEIGTTMLISQSDLGPAKRRARQSRAIDRKSISFLMSDAEKETLITFVNDSLTQGMRSFLFPRCDNTFEEVRIIPASDGVLFQLSRNSKYWAVTLQIELLP